MNWLKKLFSRRKHETVGCEHDWENIYVKSIFNIAYEFDLEFSHATYDDQYNYVYQKVCLKCGEKVDEITPLIKRYSEISKKKKEETKRRKELAQKLWNKKDDD